MKKIKTNIKKVNHIFQISDIHVRLYKRKDEYEKVFSNLYDNIKTKISDGDIILLTGDIVHTKTDMSPEMIDLVCDLLNNLADIAPVILVPGNHDANLNNLDRMDALYPIVKAIKNPNVTYLKQSGLYTFANITFSIMGIFNNKSDYFRSDSITNDSVKIAVYHGTVNGCQMDNGHILNDNKMEISFFDGFDFAMCGDIHKRQILQKYDATSKKPYVAYPGSIIQQNHSESVDKHGYLIWNLENKTYEEVDIENDFGYITLDVLDGSLQPITGIMPPKPRFRLRVNNTSATELKSCLSDIRKLYNPIEVTYVKKTGSSLNAATSNKLDFSKIRDISFQNELLKEYLTSNYPITDEQLNRVYELNKELNSKLPIVDIKRNIIWKPIKFEFSNMFSYGENNSINFENLEGIAGIFGGNATGKSSILEALTYCIFDKSSKTFKAALVLNSRKTKFHCKLEFEIDGIRYFIEKTAKKGSKGTIPVKINFWRVNADGSTENLNGDERKDTTSVIKSYIGTYEDFILTSIQSQKNPSNFADKKQTERKDLLLQFMDVTIFEKLYDIASSDMKEYKTLLKQFEKRDFDSEMETYNSELLDVDSKILDLKSSKKTLADEKDLLDSQFIEMSKEIVKIELPTMSLESLIQLKSTLESDIKSENVKLSSASANESEQTSILNKANTLLEEYNKLNIESRYLNYSDFTKKLNSVDSDINRLLAIVKNKMEKSNNLLKLEYDPNCTFCMNNIFVKDAIIAKKELEDDEIKSNKLLLEKTQLESNIKSLGNILVDNERLIKVKNLIQNTEKLILQYQNEHSKISLLISTKSSKLDQTKLDIIKYENSEKLIKSNAKIQLKLDALKKDLVDVKSRISKNESELELINSKRAVINSRIQDIDTEISDFAKKESEFETYEKYTDAMHRDSIPKNLISQSLPRIEEEVNNILSQIIDFNIMLEMDDADINIKIVYDEDRMWNVELGSGMEAFITGIAMRLALTDISSLPRPTFIAIDEGFGSLDSNNMSSIPALFDYLKSNLQFVLIISHIDHIRDFVDLSLNFKVNNGYSEIIFG
jgi:DNA repair exonuclease SbcCD ATPase subunit/predicted phosphodiesterase